MREGHSFVSKRCLTGHVSIEDEIHFDTTDSDLTVKQEYKKDFWSKLTSIRYEFYLQGSNCNSKKQYSRNCFNLVFIEDTETKKEYKFTRKKQNKHSIKYVLAYMLRCGEGKLNSFLVNYRETLSYRSEYYWRLTQSESHPWNICA